jgi:SAM-dependent methyltransferase
MPDTGRAAEFYDYPALYDALLPAGGHVPFYTDRARQQADVVLELACGTGQLTIPIALAGLPTVGLDRSRAMLDVAKRRASEVKAHVARQMSPRARRCLRVRHLQSVGQPAVETAGPTISGHGGTAVAAVGRRSRTDRSIRRAVSRTIRREESGTGVSLPAPALTTFVQCEF